MAADLLPPEAPKAMGLDLVVVEDSSCRSPPPLSYQPRVVGAALRNLGNTCFLNAVLQCLTHTVPFVQMIRKIDHSCSRAGEDGSFCSFCALKEHINRCLFLSGCVIEPTAIAENLSKISPSLELGQQEDAHEFLQSLLDNVHTSCLDTSTKNWLYSQDANSLVKQIFGGHLRSQLRCCGCGYLSNTFEPLLDLSLEINDANDVLDALASFTKLEKIDDSETKFTCEGCKSEVAMEKQLKLEQTPEVLVLHLKRFKSDGISSYKIYNQVEYPLEIDLNPCLSYPSDEVQSKYDLYAVLVHMGSTYFGHYFCFIRSSSDTWHRIDDSKVTRVPESYVLQQQAYVLFYVKRGSSCWFSQFMEEEKTLNLYDTSPTSVLEPAERYASSSSSEDNGSCLRRTPERHHSADLRIIDSPTYPTNDASLVVDGEGEPVETPSGTDEHPSDVPARQPAFESNERGSEKAVLDRVTLEGTSQRTPIQIVDSLFDDEPLEDNDMEDQLLPQVQVKQSGKKAASKPVAAEPVKDARANDEFNRLMRSMPRSRRHGILTCIASQQKSSTKRSLNSSQSNSRKKNRAASEARSSKTSCRSQSPHCIRRGLFVQDSSL